MVENITKDLDTWDILWCKTMQTQQVDFNLVPYTYFTRTFQQISWPRVFERTCCFRNPYFNRTNRPVFVKRLFFGTFPYYSFWMMFWTVLIFFFGLHTLGNTIMFVAHIFGGRPSDAFKRRNSVAARSLNSWFAVSGMVGQDEKGSVKDAENGLINYIFNSIWFSWCDPFTQRFLVLKLSV